jgi:hypothetical protein
VIGLYAIVSEAPAGISGAAGEPLRALRAGELIALVGDARSEVTPESLRAYDAAVRRIASAVDACLPARFGASARDEDALLRELGDREADLREALALVHGREQMTLRVQGPQRAPGAEPPSSGGGPGTRYLEERRRARSAPELGPLREALRELVRAEKLERTPGLLASVYHLIDRGTAAAYARIATATPLDPLRVTVSGPWPAWSFAPEVLA